MKHLTKSGGVSLPEVILAPRTDPIYNAHGYLTKVPVDAIIPYLTAFTEPGDTVLDMFAGSGMTGVAAKIAGRNALLSDISVLGKHIGDGYLFDADSSQLQKARDEAMQTAKDSFGALYVTRRVSDGKRIESVRTIWSFLYKCQSCQSDINYFEAMRALNWKAPSHCPHCEAPFSKRGAQYVGDAPVTVVVDGPDGRQVEQPVSDVDIKNIAIATKDKRLSTVPSIRISPDREMYKRSALGKWQLNETKDFFSARNAIALKYLWDAIELCKNRALKQKLRFAFTAILPRASRRYQWSPQRPLNAANQNYYIAPVYYEWNVFELFHRKVEAAIRSDEQIRIRRDSLFSEGERTTQSYVLASAARLDHASDASIDFVFTDPPFGSNLFYSDMSLFQEAWLGKTTDEKDEAVIHTTKAKNGDAEDRYKSLLRAACNEAYRVLKPGGHMAMVFGNSSGKVWSMVQEILFASGFDRRPVHIGILDKGQRSVKGLASGFESVATMDLILTVQKPKGGKASAKTPIAFSGDFNSIVESTLEEIDLETHCTPSHVYLLLLQRAFQVGAPVGDLHLSDVLTKLERRGLAVNSKSGRFEAAAA
jgi:16S rRNA G966 N2-methylase RsmD